MKRRTLLVSLALAVACLAVFGQAVRFGFLNFDDNAYVYENPWVLHGFTAPGVVWAFRAIDYFYWQPLTWLSHMLDCQLFGLRPGWHHLVNVLFHAANSVLVFLIFRRLTAAFWRSAVLAGIFALHPLHLESVMWIAERKDVLSAFFFLLTLWAYLWYVERPSMRRYICVLMALTCGLMSKPMLITTPVLLVLLDFWPLQRRAWAEKLPLAFLAALSLAITYAGTSRMQAINWAAHVPLAHRIANALVSWAGYVSKTLWPRHLAILYPYRITIPWWQPASCFALIAAVTLILFRWRENRPYLLFGWSWFLIGLLPAIGIVQVGRQSMADRFTYLPLIGLAVMAVWGATEILEHRRGISAALATVVLLACAGATLRHIGTWRDSVSVFSDAIAATGENAAAEHYLAAALDDRGQFAEALPHHAAAVRIEPDYFVAQGAYALALERQGDLAGAAGHFAEALRFFPDYPEAREHLKRDLEALGRRSE